MDERYFMYSEELDWCRAVHNAGKRVYYWPEPVVVHHGQQGQESRRIRPEVLALGFRSRYAYFEKHFGYRYARLVKLVTRAGIALRLLLVLPSALLGRDRAAGRQLETYQTVLRDG